MDLKQPLSFDEQLQRLIEHNVDIDNKDFAKRVLSEVNYYRLTGYALQFRDKDSPDDYVSGTKFETVWRIYQFDAKMRCILKPYLDIMELFARTQIAYGFAMAKCQSAPYDQHYVPTNFYNEDSHNEIIVSSLDREKANNRDSLFVIHHDSKYSGKMPLWVVVELLSFTNLSKLFSAMYYSEQDAIAKNLGTARQILKNHLHCMANFRNKVAHAGRLYNTVYNPPVKLGNKFLQHNPDISADSLFAYIIVLMRRIPNIADKSALAMAIINAVQQYSDCIELPLLGFPDNYIKRLCNEMK